MRKAILLPLLAAARAGGCRGSGAGGAADRRLRNHELDLAGRRPSGSAHQLQAERRRRARSREEHHLQRARRGSSATPTSLDPVLGPRLRPRQCPPNAQAGLITVHANYEGEPELPARHRADLQPRHRRPKKRRASPSSCRPSNIPIAIPVAVRTATDYGLRFTVSGITQLTPLAEVDLTFWGFPAGRSHNAERFPKGIARRTRPAAPAWPTPSCIADADRRPASPNQPLHRQPVRLQRRAAADDPRRRDLPGPGRARPRRSLLPADHRLRTPDLQTGRSGAA